MSVVLFEKRDHNAIFTINRPKVRNALSLEVLVRLTQAWHEVKDDGDIRVCILTGAGAKAFCSLESNISAPVFQTEDAKEGPRAFLEKSEPVFKGK